MLEERSQPTRAYIFYTIYLFHTIFLINFLLPSGYPIHMPPNFLFSRLLFVTPFHDSTRDSHSRLTFATPICNSLFFMTTPSCDPTPDGRTVSTPQHHLPIVPALTLIKYIYIYIWNHFSSLASTSSYFPPSCPPPLVALCLLTLPLAHPLLQRPNPPLPGPLPISPRLSHPLPLPPFPLYGNMSLQF